MQCLVLQKFLMKRISMNSLLNDSLEYGHFSGAAVICLFDPSLRVLLMYAWKRGREISG